MTESQQLIVDLWAFIQELADTSTNQFKDPNIQKQHSELGARVREFYSTNCLDDDPSGEPLCNGCGQQMAHTAGPEKGEKGIVCQTPGCDLEGIVMEDTDEPETPQTPE